MDVLWFQQDKEFHELFEEGRHQAGMPESVYRPARFYNLIQCFLATKAFDGAVAEAGCYRGFSSWLMCAYARREDPAFDGRNFHVIDSFEGLSEPVPADLNRDAACGVEPRAEKHLYTAGLDDVRGVLAEFPAVTFHKGWIPSVLAQLPEQRYRFVHVDVDLYQPTRDCLAYFYPRLVPGGMLVVDDYGYLDFPGAKQAVDEFASSKGARVIPLTTGNAIVLAAP